MRHLRRPVARPCRLSRSGSRNTAPSCHITRGVHEASPDWPVLCETKVCRSITSSRLNSVERATSPPGHIHVAGRLGENAEDAADVAALMYGAKKAIAKVREHLPGIKAETRDD